MSLRGLARRCQVGLLRAIDDLSPRVFRPKLPYRNETWNDRWVAESIFPGLRDGYFVEAGAANGIACSSCYVLEAYLGWTGVCIEPHPDFAERLLVNRPRSHCFSVCLGASEGQADYVMSKDQSLAYLSGVRDVLEEHRPDASEGILKLGQSLQVPMKTLDTILDEVGAPAVIDYAAFDIEGSELSVLSSFPFDRYRFRAVSVECGGSFRRALGELFASIGYREVENPFNRSRPWERYWLSD